MASPEQTPGRARIVVGVDGSPAALAALRWAAAEARRDALGVEAIIAWRPSAPLGPPAGQPPASSQTLQERGEDAERVLDVALGSVDLGGVEVTRRVERGSPHRVLLSAAAEAEAELLVIGGHGGRLSGRLPWSTGQQLIGVAACPVVVVPPHARRPSDERRAHEQSSGAARPAVPLGGSGVLPG